MTRELAVTGWRTGLELAREKGPAPIMNDDFTVTTAMLAARPEMARDGVRVGDVVKGRVLFARYSRYMQQLAEVEPSLVAELAEQGARFTHHSSIAPTGTIALSLGNNASNGIEPSFAHRYVRNVITAGRKTKDKVEVCSYELLAWRALINPKAMPDASDPTERLPDTFVTADDITPSEHIAMQAAAQRWIDSSISKTVNVPSDISLRCVQGPLLRGLRARPQRLHHVPLQSLRLSGRAGQACGSGAHHLSLHPCRRHRDRSAW